MIKKTMTTKERYKKILCWFEANAPSAESELRFENPWQLLVAVILSAQCTDKRVNRTTPALFERFPTPQSMAEATADEIYPYIRSISYPNNKARNLAAMARRLSEVHGGEVPSEREELERLPGVGRKTANVIGAVVFDRPVMAVDTHVFRVAHRTGLAPATATTPLAVELALTKNIPPAIIPRAHHWLILHGRYVCVARHPRCSDCGIAPWCREMGN
jgi:endonuclease-3